MPQKILVYFRNFDWDPKYMVGSKLPIYLVWVFSLTCTEMMLNIFLKILYNKFLENLKWLVVKIENLWHKFKDFLFCLSRRLQCILQWFFFILCGFPLNGNLLFSFLSSEARHYASYLKLSKGKILRRRGIQQWASSSAVCRLHYCNSHTILE